MFSGTFSIWHWLIVLAIVIVVFGTKKLRNIGADLGGAVRGFKEGMKDPSADGRPDTGAGGGRTIEGKVDDKTKV